MDTTTSQPVRRDADRRRSPRGRAAAFGLFLLAPLIAEYLLGNVSISALGYLPLFAALYGAGALLIRETARRGGRGWPTIILLGLAFGLIEEGLVIQTLFNPSFHGFALLEAAPIPALGMGGWWTLFVLTLHTVWSTSVPIALVEALVPRQRTTPWLGRAGIAVTAVVYVIGAALNAVGTWFEEQFVASPAQMVATVVAVAMVTVAALFAGRQRPPVARDRRAPSPLIAGATTLLVAGAFLAAGHALSLRGIADGWALVAGYLVLYAVLIAALVTWSRRAGWGDGHRLAVAGGALLAYVGNGFAATPVFGATGAVDLIGNAVLGVGAVAVLVLAWRRSGASDARRPDHAA